LTSKIYQTPFPSHTEQIVSQLQKAKLYAEIIAPFCDTPKTPTNKHFVQKKNSLGADTTV